MVKWLSNVILLSIFLSVLTACSPPPPPKNSGNICKVFKEYPKWYWIAKKTEKKWGVPVSIQLAIIHQESRFNANAKPDRKKLLWVIPWKRPSSAYGYSQSLKETWEYYQGQAKRKGKRNNFSDASDFIGWYVDYAHKRAGISKTNAYEIYLAYHEGIGGYKKKTYLKKTWLINVARKVKGQSETYQAQLQTCKKKIKKRWWYYF